MKEFLYLVQWKLYKARRRLLFSYGLNSGKILSYTTDYIETLKNVYYGGVPASLLILNPKLCQGNCYDMALLSIFGFKDDDFLIIDALVKSIKINPENRKKFKNVKNYNIHSFALRRKSDGSEWIYDPTSGFVYEKNLYFKLEKPKVIQIYNRQKVLNHPRYKKIQNTSIESDISSLPLILPFIEEKKEIITPYRKSFIEELELYKQKLNEITSIERSKGNVWFYKKYF